MKTLSFKVLGKKWKIRLLKKRKYEKENGADSVATTDTNRRNIDLGPEGVDLETIVHELVHAYVGEMCLHSTDLDDDNLEEIYAELMAKRGRELLDLGDEIFDKIRLILAEDMLA